MSVEENKEAIRRINKEVQKGNLEAYDEFLAPNCIFHLVSGDQLQGIEAWKQHNAMLLVAFPEFDYSIDEMIGEGDIVSFRQSFTMKYTGEFRGVAPTGKTVTLTEAVFIRFENGKSAEEWQFADRLSIFNQLGITPPNL